MPKEYDEIGKWSEIKLEIVKRYAAAYSTILARQPNLKHLYVDAFAGPGVHLSRTSGQFVPGSPLNALWVDPPFFEYHFIDADGERTDQLMELAAGRPNVFIHSGDCNLVLPRILPRARYEDYRRALCVLDPYNIDLSWDLVAAAGAMKSVEIFLNFMVMDINMNVLKKRVDKVTRTSIDRMNRFWGDDSWRELMYAKPRALFDLDDEKVGDNELLAEAYRERLRKEAGFQFVPKPMPMKNSLGRTIYYLFFASHNQTAAKIATQIFNKYRD